MAGRRNPRQLARILVIVVADDKMLATMQMIEDPAHPFRFASVGEVTDMPYDVVRSNDRVPVRDHGFIHFGNGREWPVAMRDDSFVAPMMVRGEKCPAHGRTSLSVNPNKTLGLAQCEILIHVLLLQMLLWHDQISPTHVRKIARASEQPKRIHSNVGSDLCVAASIMAAVLGTALVSEPR
jgi:hypothetical protein